MVAGLWGKMATCKKFDVVRAAVDDIISEGYPLAAILNQLHDDTVSRAEISDVDKALICEKLAQVRL